MSSDTPLAAARSMMGLLVVVIGTPKGVDLKVNKVILDNYIVPAEWL
jgi:hypothetical protein